MCLTSMAKWRHNKPITLDLDHGRYMHPIKELRDYNSLTESAELQVTNFDIATEFISKFLTCMCMYTDWFYFIQFEILLHMNLI